MQPLCVFRGLHGLVHAEVEKLTAQREHHAANTLLDREMFRFALFICNGHNILFANLLANLKNMEIKYLLLASYRQVHVHRFHFMWHLASFMF